MGYKARDIVDRIATGDDCFRMEQLVDGRVRLIPSPDSVKVVGTNVNKELLGFYEEKVAWILNTLFDDVTSNPFNLTFDTLDGIAAANGVWNSSLKRMEC